MSETGLLGDPGKCQISLQVRSKIEVRYKSVVCGKIAVSYHETTKVYKTESRV